jgi:hypothetical protein
MSGDLDIVSGSGKAIIVYISDSLQKLVLPATDHAATADQSNPHAETLCTGIEAALLHGIKMKEFNGIPLWGLLERLEILTPPCIPLRNTVGAVATISSLRSPLARARGWVRQVLNDGHVDEVVQFMMSQTQLLRSFYNSGSLLLEAEDGHALVSSPKYYN